MNCWKCGKGLPEYPYGKIPFKAICEDCSSWLHCCKNCKNYKPGKPNDCLIPGTEYIADREGANYCEEFKLRVEKPSKIADVNQASKRLFKEDATDLPKGGFNSLFKE